jgi:hypothetical protein
MNAISSPAGLCFEDLSLGQSASIARTVTVAYPFGRTVTVSTEGPHAAV